MNRVQTLSTTAGRSGERSIAVKAAAFALVFGIGLVFVVGFAQPNVLHNAAHDSRHTVFPCH